MTSTEGSLAAQLGSLLERLKAGSRSASADIFATVLEPLTGFLVSRHKALTKQDARDIATEAIANLVAAPDSVDSSLASAWTYLCLVAGRDATDLVRGRTRQKKLLEKSLRDVEDWWGGTNNTEQAEANADAHKIWDRYGDQLATNGPEREVLRLMLHGERETEAFARALGLSPSESETAELVKKAKDRMSARLRRLRDEL